MSSPFETPPAAASVRDENRPWLKGAMAFFENEIQPRVSDLRSPNKGDQSYRPPNPSYEKAGCLIWGSIPLIGLFVLIYSVTAFDHAGSLGHSLFVVGLTMIFGGAVAGLFISGAIAVFGAKAASDIETEKEIVGDLAAFLGFDYTPGRDPAPEAGSVPITQILDDNAIMSQFRRKRNGNKIVADWSDRMRIAAENREVLVWGLRYNHFQGIALLDTNSGLPPEVDVIGHGLHYADPARPCPPPKAVDPFEPMSLESPHFNDRFDVYTTDQVLGRRALTPVTMHRLKRVWSALDATGMTFIFSKGWFATIIALPKEPLQLDRHQSLLDEEAVLDVFDQLAALRDIVDGLNSHHAR